MFLFDCVAVGNPSVVYVGGKRSLYCTHSQRRKPLTLALTLMLTLSLTLIPSLRGTVKQTFTVSATAGGGNGEFCVAYI